MSSTLQVSIGMWQINKKINVNKAFAEVLIKHLDEPMKFCEEMKSGQILSCGSLCFLLDDMLWSLSERKAAEQLQHPLHK